jgi:hypothetical protein
MRWAFLLIPLAMLLIVGVSMAQTGIPRQTIIYASRVDAETTSSIYAPVQGRQLGSGPVFSGDGATGNVFKVDSSGNVIAAGSLAISYLDIGTGTPNVTLGAGDAYVTGHFENAGASYFGGGFGFTGCTISAGGIERCNSNGYFGGTIGATGNVTTTGAVDVGTGTPNVALGAGDTYVTGHFENLGATYLGGGYGFSGCTVSTAGAERCNSNGYFGGTIGATGNVTTTGAIDVGTGTPNVTLGAGDTYITGHLENLGATYLGGGYGYTGCTISTAGAERCNSNGYFGGTLGATGNVTTTGNIVVSTGTPNVTQTGNDLYVTDVIENAGATYLGGGYGYTGCTVSSAGAERCNSNGYFGGTIGATGIISTTDGATIGGGYGASGLTVGADGTLSTDGKVHIGSTPGITVSLEGTALRLSGAGGVEIYAGAAKLWSISKGTAALTKLNGPTIAASDIVSYTAGNFAVGTAKPSVALNGDDIYVKDHLEVGGPVYLAGGHGFSGCTITTSGAERCDSNGYFAGTIGATGVISTTGGISADSAEIGGGFGFTGCSFGNDGTMSCNDDITTSAALNAGDGLAVLAGDAQIAADPGGGNKTDRNQFIGLPRIKMEGLSTGTDGTAETILLIDADPTGEWTAKGAHVTATADTTYYKDVTSSLKLAFTAEAVITEGVTIDIANDDWTIDNSFGFWIRSSKTLGAGDLLLLVDDTTLDTKFNVCAVATANKWTWCEIDVSSLASGLGDAVDKLHIVQAAATVAAPYDIYLDAAYKWAVADEDALGEDILQDGVLGAVNTTTGGNLALYTAYFVNYQTGADAIVYIANESAATVMVMYAY